MYTVYVLYTGSKRTVGITRIADIAGMFGRRGYARTYDSDVFRNPDNGNLIIVVKHCNGAAEAEDLRKTLETRD